MTLPRATPEAAPDRRPLVGVQYLRAIAALLVAYFHSTIQLPSLTPLFHQYLLASLNLPTGVDIFFVISGFIMLVTSQRTLPKQFMVRRLIRIVPLYWALTILVAILLTWRPSLFRTTVVTLPFLLQSLAFIPYANPGQGGEAKPILVPGWSLNFEMFFYVIFAVTLLVPLRRRVLVCGILFALLTVIHQHLLVAGANIAVEFLTDSRIFEFWFGMAIGHLYLNDALRLPRPAWLALTAFGFIAILARQVHPADSDWDNVLFTMVPAACIVLGVVGLERNFGLRKLAFPLLLGDASYSIYLSHIPLLGLARFVWTQAGLSAGTLANAIGFGMFSMLLVVLGSLVIYNWFERPITTALQRRWHAT